MQPAGLFQVVGNYYSLAFVCGPAGRSRVSNFPLEARRTHSTGEENAAENKASKANLGHYQFKRTYKCCHHLNRTQRNISGKMSEKPNDSPAFRLRPRSEPKSYYTIRLEYSANPAAFTRERPRSSLTKRRTTSTKASYSKSRSRASGNSKAANLYGQHTDRTPSAQQAAAKAANVMSKEDIEREEGRKRLQRELSHSITTDAMISPFLQRLELENLKHSSVYEQNYITLKIESVTKVKQQAVAGATSISPQSGPKDGQTNGHIICRCSGTDSSNRDLFLTVHLHDEFACEKIVKVDKIMSIAKFKTGPPKFQGSTETDSKRSTTNGGSSSNSLNNERREQIDFDVIVRYDGPAPSASTASGGSATYRKPVIPYVCITDMIEEPTDPYVEMPLPSAPLPPQIQQPEPYIPETSSGSGASGRYAEAKVHLDGD